MKPQFARRRVIIAASGAVVALAAVLVVSGPAGGAGAPTTPPSTATTTPPSTSARVTTPTGTPAATAPAAGPVLKAAACPALVCAKLKVEGTSRMAKVASDVPLAPGEFAARAFFENIDPNWPLRIEGDLSLPTVRDAYLVLLRFMPSRNDIDFIQDGKVTGRGRILPQPPPNQPPGLYVKTEVVARLFVRISNVRQDGIDLKVGTNCRTETSTAIPLNAVLRMEVGATTTTQATFGLPRFSRCGTTENLDPLLTGLVSGPGNSLSSKLTVTSIGEA